VVSARVQVVVVVSVDELELHVVVVPLHV
jgi:hypothetical protein